VQVIPEGTNPAKCSKGSACTGRLRKTKMADRAFLPPILPAAVTR